MTLGRAIATHAATHVALKRAPRVVGAAFDAYDLGVRGAEHARTISRGARWAVAGTSRLRTMSGRGAAPGTVVAGEFFHGPDDMRAVMAALSADFSAFQADLARNALRPDDAAWVLSDVLPVIVEWNTFVASQSESTLSPYLLEWKTLQRWRDHLVRLRDFARVRGIKLDSDGPVKLPETVWQRAGHGTGSRVDRIFALGKWIVYAALGLMGATSLYAAAWTIQRDVKGSA